MVFFLDFSGNFPTHQAGLYEDVVLMLDYNSLYPSIIQVSYTFGKP